MKCVLILLIFQNRKLKTFILMNLTNYPEKKGYFELKNDIMKFTFPDPSQLEGKKVQFSGITFTYI